MCVCSCVYRVYFILVCMVGRERGKEGSGRRVVRESDN